MNPIKFPKILPKPPAPIPAPKDLHLSNPAEVVSKASKDVFERAKSKLDDLSDLSSEMGFQLQTLMSQMTKADAAASSIMKKHSAVVSSIIGNIKA